MAVVASYADCSADDLVSPGKNGRQLREGTATELADRMSWSLYHAKLKAAIRDESLRRITGVLSLEALIDRIKWHLLRVV